ncbi:MAG TPA: RNA-binding domain-containing protein [Hanamia sp.]
MEALEILELIQKGESSTVQFKERIDDAHKFSQELVAFSNTKGGLIIIGVNDKTGLRNGLSFSEIRDTNRLIVDSSTNNVKPATIVESQTITVDSQNLITINVEEGLSKPYKDKKGAIWVKNGSDKRRVTSNEEIARLLQSSKIMFGDEMPIKGTSINDVDLKEYKAFYKTKFKKSFDKEKIEIAQSLQNQQLYKDNCLTLAGLLVFCKNRHSFRPLFSIQCISVNDTNLLGNTFEDNEPPFEGNLKQVYEQTLNFIDRNMKKIPSGKSFNSELKWEIPKEVFEEVLVNALIHRNYFINSTIKVFMFLDRIEIISPGKLPNSQTEQTIVSGVSIPQNPVLQSIAQYILPYKGAGTGLMRAISIYPNIEFNNDQEKERFVVVIKKN